MHNDINIFFLSQESDHMARCGFHPDTLKGTLFSILFEQKNKGMKVNELAKYSQVRLCVLLYTNLIYMM